MMEHPSRKDINQIISSLSHELRTPLSIISSNIQLLKENPDLDDAVRSETFMLTEGAMAAVMRFLNDVQFVNFANKKELKSNPELFDVGQLVQEILNQTNAIFYQSDRVIVNIKSSDHLFFSDKVLLSRMITSLLDNAFRFSTKEVLLTIMNDRYQMIIEIEDQGYGIPHDQMDLIFTPFYRCDNVKMISGTGLGLAIVKGSLECLGGNIFVDSIVLKGTRVKLIIPSNGS
jgi:K+-sensing histidine kinase KdpD